MLIGYLNYHVTAFDQSRRSNFERKHGPNQFSRTQILGRINLWIVPGEQPGGSARRCGAGHQVLGSAMFSAPVRMQVAESGEIWTRPHKKISTQRCYRHVKFVHDIDTKVAVKINQSQCDGLGCPHHDFILMLTIHVACGKLQGKRK